jgi:hypothetical protein
MDEYRESHPNNEFLADVFRKAIEYLNSLSGANVGISLSKEKLFSMIDTELPEHGVSPAAAIKSLIDGVENGLIRSGSPRYFGFVIGGSAPVSIAADWLTTAWDQNAQAYGTSPAAAVELADSWATDAHKWLNVPYDSGLVIVRQPETHLKLKVEPCAYVGTTQVGHRNGSEWVPVNTRTCIAFWSVKNGRYFVGNVLGTEPGVDGHRPGRIQEGRCGDGCHCRDASFGAIPTKDHLRKPALFSASLLLRES